MITKNVRAVTVSGLMKGGRKTLIQAQTEMTTEQMLTRIDQLSSEMDANDEEHRMLQAEIDSLYAKVDADKK